MTDKELFNLCTEVYKRTGWETNEVFFPEREWTEFGLIPPLYNSDYILDKLPHASYQMDVTSAGVKLTTFYTDDKWETVHADTPLKCLLKLTIALHEIGELTHV